MATGIDERQRRIATNEVLFREVNERVRALNEAFSQLSGKMEIVCECGDLVCVKPLTISPAEYEHVRSDATWFVILPGHEVAGVESVVASRDGYDVVEKRPGTRSREPRD